MICRFRIIILIALILSFGPVMTVGFAHGPRVVRPPHIKIPKLPPPSTGRSINVRTYGAVGNGIKDDQVAINKAIAVAQATRATVYFGPGDYLHSATIIANGVRLQGAGSSTVLNASNGANGAVILRGNGAAISALVISGAHAVPQNGGWPIDSKPQAGAIWVDSATNFSVSSLTISDTGNNAIDVGRSSNGTVSDTVISNPTNAGIGMWDCNNVQVLKNNVHNAGQTAVIIGPLSTGSRNLTIANNYFQPGAKSGTQPGLFLGSLQFSKFINNNCTSYFLNLANFGLNQPTLTDVTVSGNVFNGSVPYGIVVGASASGADFANNITITNNSISNVLRSTNQNASAVTLQAAQNVNVANNTINTVHDIGITVSGARNVVIHANSISNLGSEAVEAVDQGTMFQNSGSLEVSNNQLFNCCIFFGNVIDVFNTQVYQAPPYRYSSLSIINNTLSGAAPNATDFVRCMVPSAGITRVISGNSAPQALLPNEIVP